MRDFKNIKRVILKIGSSSLVDNNLKINYELMDTLMNSFKCLKDKGIDVCLVTSGAIAIGRGILNLNTKPKNIETKQVCAAIGQAKLMEYYNNYANKYGLILGQVLLNHDDFQIRDRLNNLKLCINEMIKNNIIPIINENDVLATDEIKVGDNDTLSSLLVPVFKADLLILFSDIDGLYDKNPKEYKDAKLILNVDRINDDIYKMVGINKSDLGTGGMKTKLDAAIITTHALSNMIICNSNQIKNLVEIVEGKEIGTLFKAKTNHMHSKEHWMIFKTKALGEIIVDNGVKEALSHKKVSILPKGIIEVKGEFLASSVINIKDISGNIIAKGISNYASVEIKNLKGKNSNDFISNEYKKKEIVHANNLVIITEDILC